MHRCYIAVELLMDFFFAADCGVLDKPSNGNVSLSDGTIMGSVANYSCSAGYAIEGGATRTCQASGSWSGTAPTCEKGDVLFY